MIITKKQILKALDEELHPGSFGSSSEGTEGYSRDKKNCRVCAVGSLFRERLPGMPVTRFSRILSDSVALVIYDEGRENQRKQLLQAKDWISLLSCEYEYYAGTHKFTPGQVRAKLKRMVKARFPSSFECTIQE